LALVLACLLAPTFLPRTTGRWRRVTDFVTPVAIGLLTYFCVEKMPGILWQQPIRDYVDRFADTIHVHRDHVRYVAYYAPPLVACYFTVLRPLRLGLSVAAFLLVAARSEEHTSELQLPCNLVCRLLFEKKKKYVMS